jgi:hypothetical protein
MQRFAVCGFPVLDMGYLRMTNYYEFPYGSQRFRTKLIHKSRGIVALAFYVPIVCSAGHLHVGVLGMFACGCPAVFPSCPGLWVYGPDGKSGVCRSVVVDSPSGFIRFGRTFGPARLVGSFRFTVGRLTSVVLCSGGGRCACGCAGRWWRQAGSWRRPVRLR